MKRKYYMYITSIISVSEKTSMASLLSKFHSRNIDIVSHDEELRRVIVRFPSRELPYVVEVCRAFATTASFEFKATTRSRLTAKSLKDLFGRSLIGYEYTDKVLLFLVLCDDGMVYGESKGREIMLKYCRKTIAGVQPSLLPPSQCSFTYPVDDLLSVFEKAKACFEHVIAALGMSSRGSK